MKIIYDKPTKTKTGTIASIAEVKRQLNIETDYTEDDTILTALLETAIEIVEDDTHSDIYEVANVLEYTPDDNDPLPIKYRIVQSPLISITTVETYNGTTWSEITSDDYTLKEYFDHFEIEFDEQPSGEKIKFTFKTGYTDSNRPKRLKQAVILKAADLFDTERSNYSPVINNIHTYLNLITPHIRKFW